MAYGRRLAGGEASGSLTHIYIYTLYISAIVKTFPQFNVNNFPYTFTTFHNNINN